MSELVVNNSVNNEGDSELLTLWKSLLEDFRTLFPEDVCKIWFEDLKPVALEKDSFKLLAPNEFAAIWVRDNYKTIIERRLAHHTGKSLSVILDFVPEEPATTPSVSNTKKNFHEDEDVRSSVVPEAAAPKEDEIRISQRSLNAIKRFDETYLTNPKNTFESFVVGPGNQLAHATCIAVTRNPGKVYNPLFLYGATGLGKTHLMHAIAHEALSRKPNLKIVYMSTEKFTNEFIKAVQENSLAKFRQAYRKMDMLLIDDIHFLSGKERIQEEFFYTFNELFESQKQIVLCSDRPAAEISKLESRLVSRFQWGFVTDIQPPDLETRIAILQKKAHSMNLDLPADVVQLLAAGVTSNVRRLEGALNRVAGYMALTHRPINVAEVQRLMLDVFQEESRQMVTIETIQRKVADFYKLTLSDLIGKKRPANIAFPRQVAMYLSRLLTSHSLQRIGNEFGGRDHGTVIHACKTVENMMEQSKEIKNEVELLASNMR